MIKEILTLVVDKIPTQYYIFFERDRRRFNFQATLSNKAAPGFDIVVKGNELAVTVQIDDSLANQAKEKVKEILSNPVFDHL